MEYICIICTDDLVSDNDHTISIPCGHTFHKMCLKQWLTIKPKCPTCSKGTAMSQTSSPLYISSRHKVSQDNSNVKLKERITELTKKRLKTKQALKESRAANIRLVTELEKEGDLNYRFVYQRSFSAPKARANDTVDRQLLILKMENARAKEELREFRKNLDAYAERYKALQESRSNLEVELRNTKRALKNEAEEANKLRKRASQVIGILMADPSK